MLPAIICLLFQITIKVSVESLAFRKTEKTKARLVMRIMKKCRSTKVRLVSVFYRRILFVWGLPVAYVFRVNVKVWQSDYMTILLKWLQAKYKWTKKQNLKSNITSVNLECFINCLLLLILDYKKGFGGQYGVQADRQGQECCRLRIPWGLGEARESEGLFQRFVVRFIFRKNPSIHRFICKYLHAEKFTAVDQLKLIMMINKFKIIKWIYCSLWLTIGIYFWKFNEYALLFSGFGGKHGVQADRQDKSAVGYEEPEREHKENKPRPTVPEKGKASSLRARFEQLAAQEVMFSMYFVKIWLSLKKKTGLVSKRKSWQMKGILSQALIIDANLSSLSCKTTRWIPQRWCGFMNFFPWRVTVSPSRFSLPGTKCWLYVSGPI